MANRIVGNVYIIDSASGATALSFPKQGLIKNISFIASDTTGLLELALVTTADVVVRLSNSKTELELGDGVWFEPFIVKTLTAGTGYIYFG